MRYRQDTPVVLNDITLSVKPGEKIGVCGRTGSGKSSLFLVLSRMVEAQNGRIYVDGMDVQMLKLRTLRMAISMIPQVVEESCSHVLSNESDYCIRPTEKLFPWPASFSLIAARIALIMHSAC